MKRILGLLVLCLLLWGCTPQPQGEETTLPPVETTQAPQAPTEPAGSYLPGTQLEEQTGGSLRCYTLEEDAYWLQTLGGDVLIFSGTEKTTLTRLAGDTLYEVARNTLSCYVQPEDPSFQLSSYGITYYDPQSREVIFLDNDLKEVSRLGMSASMVGKPILSSNRRQVYYCTADAVRVYDLETGLDRLIKSISYPEQSVSGILLEDQVLRCSLRDGEGVIFSIFLSTQTGELLERIQFDLRLTTENGGYCALVPDGILDTIVFGTDTGECSVLTPRDLFASAWFLGDKLAVVTSSQTQELGILEHYDLESGKRTASLEIPGGIQLQYMEGQGEFVYLMGQDPLQSGPMLYRWDLGACALEDDAVYTGTRYTEDAPDTEGLAQCAAEAAALGEKYGIQIRIGTDALKRDPWDYDLHWEHNVAIIRQQLRKLEASLAAFPEGFFQQIPQNKIISIVRGISGSAQSGSVSSANGIQFWYGNEGHVVLTAGDTLEYAFFHEMFHIIDSKVLSDSSLYYYWKNMNPSGVRYFEDYTSYLSADVAQYLEGENRAFIDAYSLSYPKEDRARVMEYACNPGNEQYFQSQIMQNKLHTLCEGIRDAFHLEDYPEPFLWEQYLQEPLTPQ